MTTDHHEDLPPIAKGIYPDQPIVTVCPKCYGQGILAKVKPIPQKPREPAYVFPGGSITRYAVHIMKAIRCENCEEVYHV